MIKTIIIHSAKLSHEQKTQISISLGEEPQPYQNHFRLQSDVDQEAIDNFALHLQIDINFLPQNFKPEEIKLIVSDMDSTLISIECIDEIADFIGVKDQVSAITEQAMQGELDFNQSLIKRVALLEGLAIDALDSVYDERLQLNFGAENLIQITQKNAIKFALVSGGFTYFTNKLQQKLNLDFTRANTLEITDQSLTGKVLGDIVNAQAKADFLNELCQEMSIKPSQTIAMGDGANDLAMMEIAGLSVAYKAKATVQKQADVRINYSGLDSVLDFLA